LFFTFSPFIEPVLFSIGSEPKGPFTRYMILGHTVSYDTLRTKVAVVLLPQLGIHGEGPANEA
jgi:hypothetical protein